MATKNKLFSDFLKLFFVLLIILIIVVYISFNFSLSNQAENKEKVGSIVNGGQIYSYEQMEKDISILSENYSSLIESKIIGSSVSGKNIYAVKLGKGEKEILVNGAHHAYEHMTTNVLMKMIDTYAAAYLNNEKILDYSLKKVLDKISIWFVPMVNPDGVVLVQEDNSGAYNSEIVEKINKDNNDFKSWKANIRGVDLNRQYPALWEDIKDNPGQPAPADYKGKNPLTEPESLALYNFANSRNFEASIAYHSSGNVIFTRFGHNKYTPKLASLISDATGYQIIDLTSKPRGGGGFSDWFILIKNKPALTIEISPFVGPRPVPLKNWSDIWEKNKAVGLIVAAEVLNWFS